MLIDKKPKQTLPKELQKHFWDVKFEELSLENNSRFITERILNYGNLDEIRWLLSHIDKKIIRDLVKNSRNLNVKTKNYWHLILT